LKPDEFYPHIAEIVMLPPAERHVQMTALHTDVVRDYLDTLRRITADEAQRLIDDAGDPRTLGQIVGHIAEWDRLSMFGAADILLGIENPRGVVDVTGYEEPDGTRLDFESVDAFNAYQAEKHANRAWADIQALAIDTATTLHALFTHPALLHAQRLEQTPRRALKLENGMTVLDVALGWHLWILVIEHMAVDHVAALGMTVQ
jgi:hypothetical protein